MLSRALVQIAAIAALASALTIRDDAAEVVEAVEYEVKTDLLGRPGGSGGSLKRLDWKDVKPLIPTTWSGKNYGCKCAPGQSCWPGTSKWNQLNSTDASYEYKMDIQNVLTNTMDETPRGASTSGCTYVNEADPYQPNWGDRFWGSGYPGLQTARAKWDPKGVFYATATPGTEDWEVIDYGTKFLRKLWDQ